MAQVRVRDVRKSYGETQVIHGVDIEVPDGAFAALVGPSGCGKSTILRMIAGLEAVTAGRIVIGGKVVNELPAKDRDIAMVFQSYALYPHLTVAENLGFALSLRGAPRGEIQEKVDRAADILGLTPFLDRRPKHLSGGQRQRVAMGRAIVRDPQVFLFDEPLSNLDAKLRVKMRAEVKALHQRLGTTMIFVTHDQVEAMTMSDLIVALDAGRVAQIGPPLELYDRPATLFVAGFIGSPSMNFFDAALSGGRLVAAEGVVFERSGAVKGGGAVVCGLRPEHIQLAGDGPAEGHVALDARVSVVEPTGAETLVIFDTPLGALTAQFRERRPFAPGGQERLALPSAALHLFDKATGARWASAER